MGTIGTDAGGKVMAGGKFNPGTGHGAPISWAGVPPDGAGALAGIVAVGGLVKNTASDGDVYENQGTLASPAFVRVDTLPV